MRLSQMAMMIRTDYFLSSCSPALVGLLLLWLFSAGGPASAKPASAKSARPAVGPSNFYGARKFKLADYMREQKLRSRLPEDKPIVLPMTGERRPEMDDFDKDFMALMQEERLSKVPGGAAAIVYKGKLVYSRGYGYADLEGKKLVQPDSLFRICSISKIFTSVAILKLVEEGKLSLETKAFPLLNLPPERNVARQPDPRTNSITIRQLLEGSGGWNRDSSCDPMFGNTLFDAARDYSNSLRPTVRAIIRNQYCRRLQFTPGTDYCYSNFAYAVLGEVISATTGQKYADYVKEKLLAPMGIKRVFPGKTREALPGEVKYYPFKGEAIGPSLLPNIKGSLPYEYGGNFYLEAMTADSGWVTSPIEVARFTSNVFGDGGRQLQPLSPEMTKVMISRPALACWQGKESYFALGWEIENASSKEDFVVKKIGCLPGAEAIVTHYTDGTTIVFAFNMRPNFFEAFQYQALNLMEKTRKAHKYVSSK
jgi:CubicO group peptidase (beta-lactamase class C family)